MSTVPAWKRVLFWPLALLLFAFGLACVAFPVAMLMPVEPGAHLLDDSRAAFGAGTDVGVPVITRVGCVRQEYGHRARRSLHSVEYQCQFDLETPDRTPPRPALDYSNMTYAEQQAAYAAEMEALDAELREISLPRDPLDTPSSVSRDLPASAEGRPLPTLRRLSADGEPPRYGLVWADGGLARRWFQWTWQALLFWGFAAGCFLAIRALRRKLS